ncbi:MAG: hypothetical protein KME13_08780 [Myxacorys californica WJT36-NPBG1]|jgi:hypothetical protein|nr:hypothetical protein [Myxacorys californica WJT36-NPBG1]
MNRTLHRSFVEPQPTHETALQAVVTSPPPLTGQERLRVIVVGTSTGVTETIHTLHRRGFAEAGDWSPLLPTGNADEMMSILTRHQRRSTL